MFEKLKSFSLAEVLVVVAIIGITATLTLPNLNNNIEERKVISAVRKIYPELDAVYAGIISEHGKPVEWNLAKDASIQTMSNQLYQYVLQKVSTVKQCGNSQGCFPSYPNVETVAYANEYYKMILKDGAFLAVSVGVDVGNMAALKSKVANHGKRTDSENFCHGYMGKFIVDVNGMKGENQPGYDIFEFYLCNDEGFVADGDNPAGPNANADSGTAWAIKAGNRDYLKCNGLNWETKRSCK